MEPGQGGNDENVIMLGLDASIDNPEGYELTVLPDRVTIKGLYFNSPSLIFRQMPMKIIHIVHSK